MKKTAKRFFSMMLVLALVLSMAPMTVFAAPSKQEAKPQTSVQAGTTATEEKTTIDLSAAGFAAPALMNADLADIDENDPAIIAFEAELDTIKVLNAEGESVALTEEQKGTILYLYQQYLGNWAANADLLGAQTPFFLSYNDNADELGILGEMLVLANIPLEAVRAGLVSYDEITGMIQNFLYADALGVAFYGDIVRNARNEVLALVEASGAQTDAQKYMVINNWLAQNVVFDMPYIMNTDKEPGEEPMVAETPVKHEYYPGSGSFGALRFLSSPLFSSSVSPVSMRPFRFRYSASCDFLSPLAVSCHRHYATASLLFPARLSPWLSL